MKRNTLLIIGGSLVAIFILVVISSLSRDPEDIRDPSASDSQSSSSGRDDALDESSCTASGGDWNSCGSACRTTPDAPCIEVCVAYCECLSDAQCPTGLKCSDFVNEIGVCL